MLKLLFCHLKRLFLRIFRRRTRLPACYPIELCTSPSEISRRNGEEFARQLERGLREGERRVIQIRQIKNITAEEACLLFLCSTKKEMHYLTTSRKARTRKKYKNRIVRRSGLKTGRIADGSVAHVAD